MRDNISASARGRKGNIRTVTLSALCGVLTILLLSVTSCNSKEEGDNDKTGYEVSTDVAVTGFKLKADNRILPGLDSVFFSIDLHQGLIYNADSLPKGTTLRGLIPVITYNAGVSAATITMTGGHYFEKTINYKKNPTDSVDFSGRVVLTLVAQDGVTTRNYQLKVNVHKMEPDSLWWDEMAVAKLPSRLAANPQAQRTVSYKGNALSLLQESDGTYTVSQTDDLASAEWQKQPVSFSFVPDVRSMCAAEDKLYMLSVQGDLYSSADGIDWQPTGVGGWQSIIGAYADRLIGLKTLSGADVFAEYPSGGLDGQNIPAGFPTSGRSNFYTYTNKWSSQPTGLFVGISPDAAAPLANTWCFDGRNWANVSAHPAGSVVGATLIPYYVYRKTSNLWVHTEYSILLLVGGRKADGTMNRETYLSYDNGVNWYVATELMRLPDYIPSMTEVDNVVMDTKMNGSFRPQSWDPMPERDLMPWYRVKYDVDGYNVSWNCPYIYLFGGVDEQGVLSNTIWKGVLNRLTFVPLM